MMTTENLNDIFGIPDKVLEKWKNGNLSNYTMADIEGIRLEKEKLAQQLLKNQEERLEILAKQYEALKQELEIKNSLENIIAKLEKKDDNKTLLNE